MAWFLLLTVFALAPAQASGSKDACALFARGDQEAAARCVSHSQFFELTNEFIKACGAFSANAEVRMKCLQSGANAGTLELCQKAGWNLESTLSCLRAYPTASRMKACKKMVSGQENQVRCLRIGRETNQVKACTEYFKRTENRFECLENDMPIAEAKTCARGNKGESGRRSCMENFVAKRDGRYFHEGRSLASEPPKPAP